MIVPEIEKKLKDVKKTTIVLCGIETHVCVVATCIDLIARGFQVLNFTILFYSGQVFYLSSFSLSRFMLLLMLCPAELKMTEKWPWKECEALELTSTQLNH